MPRWLYILLLHLLLPLVLLRLWWRGRQAPAYRLRIGERFGRLPVGLATPATAPIWLHAVSVGETLAAQPLVAAIRARWPGRPLLITTMTPTGSARVRAIWADDIAAGRVFHVYAPYDYPWAWSRFFTFWRPAALVIMETELWPNLLARCEQAGVPVLLANARLSAKSARGYARAGGLGRGLMARLTQVAAQDQATADRFVRLGVPAERVQLAGSVKFDLAIPDGLPAQTDVLRRQWALQERLVWVAASTHAGEDAVVLQAHRQLLRFMPEALLILVPRHPERFDEVARQVAAAGLAMARRSQSQPVTAATQVLLADSMGELLLWFSLAQVAFIGGSLVPVGGHNPLEPLALGVPTLSGPHYHNFQVINDSLLAAGALALVADADTLADAVLQLCNDEALARARRAAGLAVMAANRGAVARHLALLTPWLDAGETAA